MIKASNKAASRKKACFLLIASKAESFDGNAIHSEEMAERRLSAGKWGLYANTPHKSEIAPGDDLIVYLAGRKGMRFTAFATAGQVDFKPRNYKADGDALTDPPVAVLDVLNVRPFRRSVAIHEIKDRLDFIPKGTLKWGCVLQRGLKRLTAEDAAKIAAAEASITTVSS